MGLHALGEKSRWAFRSFCLHRRSLSPLRRPPLPAAAVTQPGRRRRNRLAPPPPPRRRLAPAACQRQRRRRTAGAAAQSQRGVGGGRGRHAGGTMAAAAGGCAPPSPHPRPELTTRGGYGGRFSGPPLNPGIFPRVRRVFSSLQRIQLPYESLVLWPT